jgi:hypothetical protein
VTILFSVVGAVGSAYKFLAAGSTAQNLYIAAAAAALITWLVISDFYYKNCLDSPRPIPVCSAGVIEASFAAFSSVTDQIFAFAATHDRIDVVVKSIYWDLVSKDAPYVNCAPNNDPPYDDKSPMLSEFYHNDAVCRAGLGGSIGALAGGVAGTFLGVLAAGAIASLSCGPFAWLCAILAIVVAIIVAVVSAVIGAVVGSQIGRAADPSRALPIDPTAPDFPSSLSVGDYVSTSGTLMSDSDANGMYVYWFVDNTHRHGQSPNKPPFSYKDPDANLGRDACCIPPDAPIF